MKPKLWNMFFFIWSAAFTAYDFAGYGSPTHVGFGVFQAFLTLYFLAALVRD